MASTSIFGTARTFTLGQAIRLSRYKSLGFHSPSPRPSRLNEKGVNDIFNSPRRWSIITEYSWNGFSHLRSYSSLPQLSDEEIKQPPAQSSGLQKSKHQAAYDRLRPIIDTFEGPVDWAVAYGSGVIHQANRPISGEAPLTDFMLSTPSAIAFHRVNIRQNPSHYPFFARILGARGVSWVQEHWGAGVWYVTMVKVKDLYGIISTSTLADDLTYWKTLYISGRLHKPHLPLISPSSLLQPLLINLRSALALALILLPEKFTELQLWEKIAGLSYAGDPRMSVPGAENPEKVKNIVRGEGVLEGFREMYGDLVENIEGLEWVNEKTSDGWTWFGNGENLLMQPITPEHLANLLLLLPKNLLHPIARHYRPTIVGSLVSPEVKAQRVNETTPRREVPSDKEFWIRVAGEKRIREVALNALTQSIKGLFTAGFTKSFYYSLAKFRKWWKARQKRAAATKQ